MKPLRGWGACEHPDLIAVAPTDPPLLKATL